MLYDAGTKADSDTDGQKATGLQPCNSSAKDGHTQQRRQCRLGACHEGNIARREAAVGCRDKKHAHKGRENAGERHRQPE